jgi:hypothetical protein
MGGHTEGRDLRRELGGRTGDAHTGGASPRPVTRTRISSEGRPSPGRARTPTLGKLTATRASHPVASGAATRRPGGPAAGTPHSRGGAGSAGRSGAGTARTGASSVPHCAAEIAARSATRWWPLRAERLAEREQNQQAGDSTATSASSSSEGWPDSSAGRPPKAAGESPNQIWKRAEPIAGHRAADRATAQRARVIETVLVARARRRPNGLHRTDTAPRGPGPTLLRGRRPLRVPLVPGKSGEQSDGER